MGIFHETYRLTGADVETMYVNMPAFGLGGATVSAPAGAGRQTAAARLGIRPDGALPVNP